MSLLQNIVSFIGQNIVSFMKNDRETGTLQKYLTEVEKV